MVNDGIAERQRANEQTAHGTCVLFPPSVELASVSGSDWRTAGFQEDDQISRWLILEDPRKGRERDVVLSRNGLN